MYKRQEHSVFPRSPKPPSHYARYSLAKFKAYARYRATAPWWRILLVLVFTPATTLLASLLPPLVHLRDPNDGLAANLCGFMTHTAVTLWIPMIGASIQYRAGAQITHDEHPTAMLILASIMGTALLTGLAWLISYAWRFPVPFFWVIFATPWTLCFVASHVLVTRGRLLSSQPLRRKAIQYFPAFVVQISQIVNYPGFSAVFEAGNEWQKLFLTLLFPFVKFSIKKILRKLSTQLGDYAEEAAISSVEICGSMYQSMIMQTSPSMASTAVIMGVDVVQGLLAGKLLLEKLSVVPQHEIIATALAQLEHNQSNIHEDELTRYGTKQMSPIGVVRSLGNTLSSPRRSIITVAPSSADSQPTSAKKIVKNAVVLVHALEILQAAESMLLVEYLEVAIPFVNSIFLMFAAQFHSAIYNGKLYGFYYHRDRLGSALQSLALYTVLQLVSVLLMVIVMRVRFKMSPTTLLAFHLERHAWSLQGKMVAWVPLLMQFTVIHYGTDFSFRFKFKVPTPDD